MFSVKKCFKFKFQAITFHVFFWLLSNFPDGYLTQIQQIWRAFRLACCDEKFCCCLFSVTWTRPSLSEICVVEMKTRTSLLPLALVVLLLLSAVATYNHVPLSYPFLQILFSCNNFIISFNLVKNLLFAPLQSLFPTILSPDTFRQKQNETKYQTNSNCSQPCDVLIADHIHPSHGLRWQQKHHY